MTTHLPPDPIPLSALQHWIYCPRQCALIHVEQAFADNLHTARGQAVHRLSTRRATKSKRACASSAPCRCGAISTNSSAKPTSSNFTLTAAFTRLSSGALPNGKNCTVCFGNVMVSPVLMHRLADDGKCLVLLDDVERFKARLEGGVSGNILLRQAHHRVSLDAAFTPSSKAV